MRLPPSAISALLVCVVGCGKSAKECKTEAEAFGKALHDAPHEPEMFMLTGRHLVQRPDLAAEKTLYAPAIDIKKSEVSYQGQLIDTREALQAKLEATRQSAADAVDRGMRDIDPELVYLVIDDDATWDQVVLAFDAAEAAGMVKQAFVFDLPVKLTPPPRTSLDVELDKLQADPDASDKASKVAKMVSDRIGRCKPLQKLFGQVSAVESGASKADIIIAGMPAALVECGCDVDMPQLKSVMWRLLVTEHSPRVYKFAPRVRDETIALPATTTWAEASKKFVRPLRGAKLAVQ